MEQIIRIPNKYWELINTMEDCECWRLMKALFLWNSDWLEWLTLTYYNIIIVDINNIQKQVDIWKANWKKWAEYWKLWWRPKKKPPIKPPLETPPTVSKKTPNIIECNIIEDNIIEDNINNKEIIIAEKSATLETYIKKEFSLEFINDIYNKYNLSKESFSSACEDFVNYRTEKKINWKKEKWEMEKTFDPKLRFRTWIKRNNSFKWNLHIKKERWISRI